MMCCGVAMLLIAMPAGCRAPRHATTVAAKRPAPIASSKLLEPRPLADPPGALAASTHASTEKVEPVAVDSVVPSLTAQAPWIDLPIEGHQPAIVSLPLGATGRRPVVVAAQGLADNPKWWCERWRDRIGNRGFVLCPRGVVWGPLPSGNIGYRYINARELEIEVLKGLDALAARYADYVDLGPVLFVGFSMGANFGAEVVQRHPARFPRAILIEGGNTDWNDRSCRKFAKAGGGRILFGCGTEGCLR